MRATSDGRTAPRRRAEEREGHRSGGTGNGAKVHDGVEQWSLQVQIGLEPVTDPIPLMETLAGRRAAERLEDWLRQGGSLLELTTQGAPREWPAAVRRRIEAAVRLVRLGDRETARPPDGYDTPAAVVRYLAARHLPCHVEQFGIIVMNAKQRILRDTILSRGTTVTTLVSTADILRIAIAEAAWGVLSWHNHPSGDPKPTWEDKKVWGQMETALEATRARNGPLILTRRGAVDLPARSEDRMR